MKKPTILFLVVILTFLSVSCSSDSSDDNMNQAAQTAVNDNVVAPEAKAIENDILDLINDYRIGKGLNPLNKRNIIKSQAFSHTEYMVNTNNVSHDNFNQRRAYLINNAGASYVSENVAYGFTSAETVVNAWINSDAHRENIEGNYAYFDISAEQNSHGDWYYTNIFVR
ncbi:CAP domain-containing protein [Corallibacter sp.]|uniref:CAP domain-containing protein n=1 Tax=Corallibacter sp. TaxID=2038084 RepID=UPI003A933300